MNKKEFEDLLSMIVSHTVNIIAKRNNWDEDYALKRFIRSSVYDALEDEKTKVWHFSTYMLAELFQEEREGNLVWPVVL